MKDKKKDEVKTKQKCEFCEFEVEIDDFDENGNCKFCDILHERFQRAIGKWEAPCKKCGKVFFSKNWDDICPSCL
ncbi:MAG: hypothetical protein FWE22_03340 [Firmicutes bacterium]|nr:hypothetical protein [Bacillota bacterium]